jgi:parallel beta-helix repeat protein
MTKISAASPLDDPIPGHAFVPAAIGGDLTAYNLTLDQIRATSGGMSSLAGDASALDVDVDVYGLPTNATAYKLWIVIDPFTDQAEIRTVTAITGTNLTINAALTYSHAADDQIIYLTKPEANTALWGMAPDATAAANRTRFKRAIDSAEAGAVGKVYIPPGTYYVNTAANDYVGIDVSNLEIELDRQCTLAVPADMADDDHTFLSIRGDVQNVWIHGGTLQGNRTTPSGSNQNGVGIEIRGGTSGETHIHISDMIIKDWWTDGIGTFTSGAQTGSRDILIENVNITNCRRQGISITGANVGTDNMIRIKDFYITNIGGLGSAENGIDIEPDADEMIENVVIDGGYISGCSGSGLAVINGATGSTRNVMISNTVLENNTKYGSLVQAMGVKFSNCRIRGNGYDGIYTDALLGELTIDNCDIGGNSLAGVSFYDGKRHILSNSRITSNLREGVRVGSTPTAGFPDSVKIIGNYVGYNGMPTTGYVGIDVKSARQCDVIGNTVEMSGKHGISLQYAGTYVVDNNTIMANGRLTTASYNGIQVAGWVRQARITNNIVRMAKLYHTGTAQAGGTSTQIILDTGADPNNKTYNNCWVYLASGTGSPASNFITDYVGSSKIATVQEAWSVNPNATTVFKIWYYGVEVGNLQSATATTAVLSQAASTVNGYYTGWWIAFWGGTGSGQAPQAVTGYTGNNRTITVASWPTTTPDTTSNYRLYPPLVHQADGINVAGATNIDVRVGLNDFTNSGYTAGIVDTGTTTKKDWKNYDNDGSWA